MFITQCNAHSFSILNPLHSVNFCHKLPLAAHTVCCSPLPPTPSLFLYDISVRPVRVREIQERVIHEDAHLQLKLRRSISDMAMLIWHKTELCTSTKDNSPTPAQVFVPKRFNLRIGVFISWQIHKTLSI